MVEIGMSRDIDSVCLAIQELVEFRDQLIQLSKDEEGTILESRISERLDTLLFSYLGPCWSIRLIVPRMTEEQNAGIDGGQRATRGILEGLESLDDRVANPIFESEVFVALVWLWANLEKSLVIAL